MNKKETDLTIRELVKENLIMKAQLRMLLNFVFIKLKQATWTNEEANYYLHGSDNTNTARIRAYMCKESFLKIATDSGLASLLTPDEIKELSNSDSLLS